MRLAYKMEYLHPTDERHVAGWNEKAINLYKKTGFEITETIEF